MKFQENVCPTCGGDTHNLALVEQLMTWEDDAGEIVECKWHKRCYRKAAGKAAMDSLLRTIADEPEGELASAEELVGQAVAGAGEVELGADGFPQGTGDPEMN